ncbi:hypothetical protein PUV44_18045 [Xanthomonas arboricola pv. corylina]|nr:hypothetical protein PUV44_18045 [Xanthomonas arboricola pv. corylina]
MNIRSMDTSAVNIVASSKDATANTKTPPKKILPTAAHAAIGRVLVA